MKKRILSLFLAIFTMVGVPPFALAAETAEPLIVPAPVIVPSPEVLPFTDVSLDNVHIEGITRVYRAGLMGGVSATSFNPYGSVTRQQMWMILARMAGAAEVKTMTDAAAWVLERGLSDGTNPTAFISRQQFAAMLYRYAQMNGQGFTGNWAFPLRSPDASDVADYAYEPLCWLTMKGVMAGDADGNLLPMNLITRAQAATMLARYLQMGEPAAE